MSPLVDTDKILLFLEVIGQGGGMQYRQISTLKSVCERRQKRQSHSCRVIVLNWRCSGYTTDSTSVREIRASETPYSSYGELESINIKFMNYESKRHTQTLFIRPEQERSIMSRRLRFCTTHTQPWNFFLPNSILELKLFFSYSMYNGLGQ